MKAFYGFDAADGFLLCLEQKRSAFFLKICATGRGKQDTVHRNVSLPCTAMAFLSIPVTANTSFLKIARETAENPNRLDSCSVQCHRLAQSH